MRIAPALLSVVGAVYLVLVATYSRPIADDWWFAAIANHHGVWASLHRYWNVETDRFTALGLAAVALKLFGLAAVNVVPLLVLCLLWAALARAATLLGNAGGRPIDRLSAAAIGLLVTVAIAASAPGLFDTIGWFTSTVSYLAGVTAVAWLAVWVAKPDSGHLQRSAAVGVALGFIASGFHELIGALIFLGCVLVAGSVVVESRGTGHCLRSMTRSLAVGIGAMVGVILNLLGPGTSGRAATQHAHIALASAARTGSHTLRFVHDDLHAGILALAIGAGVVGWQLLGAAANRRAQRRLLASIVFLLLAPWLVTSAMSAWGGSLEPGYRVPFRVAFLTTGSVAFALVLLVPAVLYYAPSLLSQTRATLLASVLILGGLLGFAHRATPIIRAEQLRAGVTATRSAAIRAGVAEHNSEIVIEPAPLLMVDTQVYDLPFGSSDLAREWNLQNLRAYFDVPSSVRLVAATKQPRDYCLPGIAATWMGVESCQELAASH